MTVPFIVLFLILAPDVAPAMYFGGTFFGSCMIGPVLAVTQSLAKVRMRAVAAALVAMTFNVIGTGFGPLAVGIGKGLQSSAKPVRIRDQGIRWISGHADVKCARWRNLYTCGSRHGM